MKNWGSKKLSDFSKIMKLVNYKTFLKLIILSTYHADFQGNPFKEKNRAEDSSIQSGVCVAFQT